MMDRTQHVIDAIDGALDDWTVGPDAMRWSPQPTGIPLIRASRPRQNGRGIWRPPARDPELSLWIDVDVSRMQAAIQEMTEAFARAFSSVRVARFAAAIEQLPDVDEPSVTETTEHPPARALRLLRERNTGPSRDLTRQRRPRRLS